MIPLLHLGQEASTLSHSKFCIFPFSFPHLCSFSPLMFLLHCFSILHRRQAIDSTDKLDMGDRKSVV